MAACGQSAAPASAAAQAARPAFATQERKMFRKDISAEITINATPERVWEIFSAFDVYKDWNPFVKTITGEVRVGKQIALRIQPPGASGMTFKPTILAFIPNGELRWLGHFVIPGLFDGEHAFQLIDNGDASTLFRQSEICRGILVGAFSAQDAR
jgi:hypothetical protein